MNVVIFAYMTIFMAPLAGYIFLKEKMKKHILPLIFLAFFWVILVLYRDNWINLSLTWWELLAFTCAMTITGTMLIVKKTPEINPWIRIIIAYAICSILLGVYIWQSGRLWLIFSNPKILFIGILLSLLTGTFGRWLKDIGTSRLPLHIASITLLLEPVLQITSWIVFGREHVGVINIFGATLVLVSMLLVNIELPRRTKPIIDIP
jgi:drug/metabolite transporter (DMT)-like permease